MYRLRLPSLQYSHGMTLIEMMVVVAIVGVLMAVGVPSYRTWIENSAIRSRTDFLMEGLRQARTEAIKNNASVRFSLANGTTCVPTNGGHHWVVWQDPAVVPTALAGCNDARILASSGGDSVGANAIVKSVIVDTLNVPTADTRNTIQFSSLGRVLDNIQGGWWVDVDVPTSVLPANKSRNLRITVSQAGQIRMCDPDVENVLPTNDPRRC
ncbi:hypothetical protein GCM10007907_26930 [Chitinimonas prasina]|uniref:Type II secretion system protein H n=1 Tax=Chitinimonas prasina TaxID=1434937 RepID=A0ABQ5YHI4_9NEIS|nr:GspH/FimT family pseudopilin [Chitinimonas prasina]GLR13903.1 hypothetical protein GCM10007907_26930 [Chitinimonas prasina]